MVAWLMLCVVLSSALAGCAATGAGGAAAGDAGSAESTPGDASPIAPPPTEPGPGSGSPDDADGPRGADAPLHPEPDPGEQAPAQHPAAAAIRAALPGAAATVRDMSLPRQAGLTLMPAISGVGPVPTWVRRLHVGGVIVLPAEQLDGRRTAQLGVQLRRQTGRSVLLGVDQEGGSVARLSWPLTELPPFMAHGAARDPALTRQVTRAAGTQLAASGVSMVFAPVADVTAGPSDPTIGARSPAGSPALAATVVPAAVEGYLDAGVVPVIKHFPGHGSVPADSHTTLPVQRASRATLEQRDLVPFAAAVQAGAPATMVGHLDVRAVDAGVPATVSRPVITGMLRRDLGFDGLVVTDALNMAGVTGAGTSGQLAVRALAAGADLLLAPVDPAAARAGIVAAVRAGRLPRARVEQAAIRVVAASTWAASRVRRPFDRADGDDAVAQLARAAVTVVSGPCPRPDGPRPRLVPAQVQVVGGTMRDRTRFADAAGRTGGLSVGGSGPVVRLLGPGQAGGAGSVVVALDVPYPLSTSTAATARLAAFGRTPATFDAVVAVLLGRADAPGRLPVPVALPPRRCP